eukprot:TRINITY_DN98595_c0_g1_i1.p1 TRINITY_DN98595_c0_g1~~TRINITY_DN98595_c0_g1_i1.p1  ORF type:complete len:225 (-),score=33.96 TRINITY_DN98595_c0_g1_i1:130-804(-)
MFSGCCCVDSTDGSQLTFSTAATDEHVPSALKSATATSHSSLSPPPLQASAAQAHMMQDKGPADAELPASARSLTAEEKEVEKKRLQVLVNNFAKKAVRGCPCVYIKEGSAEKVKTHYRIDKGLENLLVVNAKDTSNPEVVCPMVTIQDIYSLAEDGASCFPQEVIRCLKPEETELLLMVVFSGSGAVPGKLLRFCILEESRESRDVFLECLRILCIYAQSNRG